jgi:hypothetical protein
MHDGEDVTIIAQGDQLSLLVGDDAAELMARLAILAPPPYFRLTS